MPAFQQQQGQTSNSRNRVLVPQAKAGLNNMKIEAAQQLGVQIPADGYYGNVTSRETGALGGYITKNLVAMAEQQLSGQAGINR
ncbi:small, acid-soluble spore protein, alpha/beta type [Cohnella sp. CFH 77786]|uniref:alpha/beta-type small acid-soluble spore protein n=1 Tax=Cohnella sp. CFH 77786 TaxID=2662265 RepID=UPI001C60E2B9|nr:alpha/beta-type small acid-soluble spore protein [Cohnella sp. CFH 77786]MBW5447253.1 small, acid-soluble spore protein, alpha/beta type [Cohnella sp. CFH 77786]